MTRYVTVELYCGTTDQIITSVRIPEGSPGCLTGVIDLPVGYHEIYLRVTDFDDGATGSFESAALQVIVGQTVEQPGCLMGGGIG